MSDIHYGGGGAYFSDSEISKAQKKYDLFNTSYIRNIFKDIFNLKIVSFEKPKSWGLPHVIFIVGFLNHKDLVLRANLGPKKPEVNLLIEKLIAEKVKKAGIKTNEIIYVDISRKKYPFDFQIQEKFAGLDPEIVFKGVKKDYDRISFQLGQTIAKLSEITFNKFGRFDENEALKNNLIGTKNNHYDYIVTELESNLEFIGNNNYLTNTQIQRILKLFDGNKQIINLEKGSLVHYDLADHNLRYNPQTFDLELIFDWESAVSSDPMLDLASCPTWTTLYEREKTLLKGYQSIKKLPDNYQDLINLYRLRTVIWKIVHNIRFGIINEKRLKKLSNALLHFNI
ncbi:phosphotransferase [Patescibacteria group bacterium]|nr:phosphotransferase [Patescibacteria group bacterium]